MKRVIQAYFVVLIQRRLAAFALRVNPLLKDILFNWLMPFINVAMCYLFNQNTHSAHKADLTTQQNKEAATGSIAQP